MIYCYLSMSVMNAGLNSELFAQLFEPHEADCNLVFF